MQNRKILMEQGLKVLRAISKGDIAKKPESFDAQEIASYAPSLIVEFRLTSGVSGPGILELGDKVDQVGNNPFAFSRQDLLDTFQ